MRDARPMFFHKVFLAFALAACCAVPAGVFAQADRKSTRLNSSHVSISYAVFCLKKKKLLTSPSDRCVCIPALGPPRTLSTTHTLPPSYPCHRRRPHPGRERPHRQRPYSSLCSLA